MKIFFPRETARAETRAPVVPETVAKLSRLGVSIEVETGIGSTLNHSDEAYMSAGAEVSRDRSASLALADAVMRLRKPPIEEIELIKPGCLHVSYLDPFNEHELVRRMAERGISAASVEMIPRTTLAQKMDALSSQANVAGYAAVLLAASELDRIFPMMMTPAGTLSPARVFVVGVGVAGLQAIATARRLGARVEAFDTRPVVEEQVRSLGAKFVKIDVGETGQTAGGYAKALTEEQLARQREGMARICAQSDVVITTAQVFGRRAPLIITTEMVRGMKPGSIVVDMAVESGGNVECSRPDEVVEIERVRVFGHTNLAGRVASHASQMYSNNLGSFVEHFWDKDNRSFRFDLDDEILRGCLVTHEGRIVNETIRNVIEGGA